ncbi:hypothetical protein V8G54_035944 [Vigna mungo]|uniref:Bidirectional sugar transporter SWEET n=1 Tax=Vigna mungo TaxID=3915 RepID=A0AAQ3RG38_VIGMU
MALTLLMVVAVLGNVASMSLYAAPTVTFKRVIRKKSTEEFSCIPYIIALMNSLLYTWYGLPVVSNKWENFPLVTVNGVGVLFELSYVLIYFWYSSPKGKASLFLIYHLFQDQVKVAVTASAVLTVVGVIAIVSTFAIPDHRHRKLLVGSISLGVSIALYASPLVAMKKVIETKSVEFMPLPLSLSSLLVSLLWMTYGLLIRDIFVALVLHCKYGKRRQKEEPNKQNVQEEKVDMEMGHHKDGNVPSN